MVTGDTPHKDISLEELVSKAKSKTLALPLPKAIPEKFVRLVNYCFGKDSDDHPSFRFIVALIVRLTREFWHSMDPAVDRNRNNAEEEDIGMLEFADPVGPKKSKFADYNETWPQIHVSTLSMNPQKHLHKDETSMENPNSNQTKYENRLRIQSQSDMQDQGCHDTGVKTGETRKETFLKSETTTNSGTMISSRKPCVVERQKSLNRSTATYHRGRLEDQLDSVAGESLLQNGTEVLYRMVTEGVSSASNSFARFETGDTKSNLDPRKTEVEKKEIEDLRNLMSRVSLCRWEDVKIENAQYYIVAYKSREEMSRCIQMSTWNFEGRRFAGKQWDLASGPVYLFFTVFNSHQLSAVGRVYPSSMLTFSYHVKWLRVIDLPHSRYYSGYMECKTNMLMNMDEDYGLVALEALLEYTVEEDDDITSVLNDVPQQSAIPLGQKQL